MFQATKKKRREKERLQGHADRARKNNRKSKEVCTAEDEKTPRDRVWEGHLPDQQAGAWDVGPVL